MTTGLRWSWWGLGVWMWLGVMVGCGDDDLCEDVQCDQGQECVEGICVSTGADCDPVCDDGEVCDGGRCISAGGGCDEHGQACQAADAMQWHGEYLCLDWTVGVGDEAVCSRDCREQGCPEGSQCFLVGLSMSSVCSDDSECGEREVCVDGECLVAACRPSQCDATAGAGECDPGERCDRIGTGVDLCIEEGTRQPGENCLDPTVAFQEQRFSEGCASGSVCVGGICRSYCDGGQCGGDGEECQSRSLGEDLGQVDVCAPTCDPDDEDDCGAGETCVPTVDGAGLCQPTGSVPAFEACALGQSDCEEGTICAETESDESLARCLPVCDLSVGEFDEDGRLTGAGQSARDQTCPQPESAGGLWMMGHLVVAGETVDLYVGGEPVAEVEGGELATFEDGDFFEVRPPGTVDWAVREAGAPTTDIPEAEGGFSLDSGEVRILVLQPVPGEDWELEAEVVELDSSSGDLQWIQGIPDLEAVDVWAAEEGEAAVQWIDGLSPGEARGVDVEPGVYDLWLVAEGDGEDGEALVEYSQLELTGDETLAGFGGTMDVSDIHSPTVAVIHGEQIPQIEVTTSLPLTCRAVNDGTIGGCMERCDGGDGLETGRCQGADMGCGPRRHLEREQWTSVCQPVGDLEEGAPCNPDSSVACAEGLYCERIGDAADDWSQSNQAGRCARLCTEGDDADCGEERGCRPMDGAFEYDVGECRVTCEPDGNYEDPDCPSGLRRCLPEAELVPASDDAVDVEERQPFCWAAGTAEVGEQCMPGNCVPGSECIFERSVQPAFVESMLSPYIPTGGVWPRCRPICDPFTAEHSNHQCGGGETCLFNFPWNANVGHCAEIAEDLSMGESCDQPGLACGEDAICVYDGGTSQCVRFCQFVGPEGSGYARSTCPVGHECQPLINDIGVCG